MNRIQRYKIKFRNFKFDLFQKLYHFKEKWLPPRDIETAHIRLRITGLDGLTKWERQAIIPLIEEFGYKSLKEFANENGYDSVRGMAYNHGFKNVRDFFLADEWDERLMKYYKDTKKISSQLEELAN